MVERGVGARAKFIFALIRAPDLAGFCRIFGKVTRCDITLHK